MQQDIACMTLELRNQTPIIRMPCMAHVIQLSLKELLGRMEANPKNDRARQEDPEITYTLNKVSYTFSIISACTYSILDSTARRLYHQKPPTPRGLPERSDNRTKACTDARCHDPIEFNLANASAH